MEPWKSQVADSINCDHNKWFYFDVILTECISNVGDARLYRVL